MSLLLSERGRGGIFRREVAEADYDDGKNKRDEPKEQESPDPVRQAPALERDPHERHRQRR